MASGLPAHITAAMQEVLDAATSTPCPSIPGLVYCSVNRDGDLLFAYASGARGLDHAQSMSLETIFWMASCTKLLTSIACMQVVEQGRLDLDNVEQVESLAPELKAVQVLERAAEGGFRLAPKERGITLRMLLNHTGV